MRAEIVRDDGGRGRGRGRAQIRPVDGPGRGPVDRAAHVPAAAAVLRENTIAPPAERQNVRPGVLPDVPGRPAHARGRL